MGSMPVTRKNSGCAHLMLGRHPIFAGITTAALMLDLGFSLQAELRTDSTSAKGLASCEELDRYDTSTAQPCDCNRRSHDGNFQLKSERKLEFIAEHVRIAREILMSQTCWAS